MNARNTKIGRITLLETTQFEKLYEFARWFRKIECAPQTVDLHLMGYGSRYLAFMFWGQVVASDFSPCFGGVPFADGTNKDLGQWDSIVCQPYEYQLMSYLHDRKYHIILNPDVRVSTEVKVLERDKPQWAFTSVFTHIETGVAA